MLSMGDGDLSNKICMHCRIQETSKWYSGPTCRRCYRAQPHIRKSERRSSSKWYIKNKDRAYSKTMQWREKNKERFVVKQKQWYENNKDSEYQLNRKLTNCKKLRSEDVNFKIAGNLRSRLYSAFKNNHKTGSAVKDLGCSIKELKKHLEAQFQPGMSWDNYGEWHIDHIEPLSSFDLSDYDQLRKACHYTNLQPLWAEENLSKGANYEV